MGRGSPAGGPISPASPVDAPVYTCRPTAPLHTGTVAEHGMAGEAVHRRSWCGVIWAHMELSHRALQAPGRMAPRLHNHRQEPVTGKMQEISEKWMRNGGEINLRNLDYESQSREKQTSLREDSESKSRCAVWLQDKIGNG